MANHSHYPSFDVMQEQDEWDDHTQSIVTSRLKPDAGLQFLSKKESAMLRRICSLLIDDESEQVLAYVIRHIDRTLQQSPGEAERPLGAPKAPDLIREGLAAIEQSCKSLYHYPFLTVDINKQRQYLHELSQSTAEPADVWTNIPQQVLFKKLLQLTVEAYYSHPAVWSEIGYAGPAYPRGYVRTQLGQLDPWEAQPET